MSRSRKSRPKSPFLNYVLGKLPAAALPTSVPNCPDCHSPRHAVAREAVPVAIWNEGLAPLWKMMEEQGDSPNQIAYCAKCGDYGILGGWESF